jgi:hypothetical protein
MAGFYLSDNYTDLTRWAFPAEATIPPGGFLVVWCDGESQETLPDALHANFRLASGSGSIALSRQLDEPQLVSCVNYTNLPAD